MQTALFIIVLLIIAALYYYGMAKAHDPKNKDKKPLNMLLEKILKKDEPNT